jgi:MYXO-CTERM domain-containing protein
VRRAFVGGGLVLACAVALMLRSRHAAPAEPSACAGAVVSTKPAAQGTLVTWVLPSRPSGPCALGVDGAFTASVATLISADGTRTRIAPRHSAQGVQWVLDDALLTRTVFPATLDPVLSATVAASISVLEPVGAEYASALPEGAGWIATAQDYGGTVVAQLDATGHAMAQGEVPGAQAVLFHTDRYVLLTTAGVRTGATFNDLVDGGIEALPAGLVNMGVNMIPAVVIGSGADGALVAAAVTLPDAGEVVQVRRLGPDLSWDGGGYEVPAYLASSGAIEGTRVYFNYPTMTLGWASMMLTPEGAPAGPLTLADGGPVPGTFTSNGVDATIAVWFEQDAGTQLYRIALFSGGAVVSPVYDLGGGNGGPTAWDGRTFRTQMERADGGLDEYLLATDGGLSAPTRIVALRMPTSNTEPYPRVYSLSAGTTGALLLWMRGGYDACPVTASVLPLGASALLDPDGGQNIFFLPNVAVGPSVAATADQIFATWNDDRLGARVTEVWGRRFTSSLQPIDSDAFTTNPDHQNAEPDWDTIAPDVAALGDGWIVINAQSFWLREQRFDANGKPVGTTISIMPFLGDIATDTSVVSDGSHALISWEELGFTVDFNVAIVFADGGVVPATPLGVGSAFTGVFTPFDGAFAAISNSVALRIGLDGTLTSLPIGPFPLNTVVASAASSDRLLLGLGPLAQPGPLTAVLLDFDGGELSNELIADLDGGFFSSQFAWDGRRFYANAVQDQHDGGYTAWLMMRHLDGGWTAPLDVAEGLSRLEFQMAAVPDAGLVIAFAKPSGPVTLQRVTWVDNGGACGADSDCEVGFCVDGVCCDTLCGGGAIDCQACSVALGATRDGTCTLLAASRVCRPAASVCDVAEVCDGVTLACPADVHADAGIVCRPAVGSCDAPESCDGVSALCPADLGQDGGSPLCTEPDGGPEPLRLAVGCGCGAGEGTPGLLALTALVVARARRRRALAR